MLFLTPVEFFDKAKQMKPLSREQEKELYSLMKTGDMQARERIVQSYVNIVACKIKRLSKELYSLDLIYNCLDKLEKAVDTFDFSNDGESFTHRLTLIIQKEIANYIAKE